jgi:hypothetical protein
VARFPPTSVADRVRQRHHVVMSKEARTALVDEFAHCVAAQGQAIAKGDAASGNTFAKRYVAAFQMLRLHGDCGRDALAVLLSDPRADVRVMAAAFLLRHCEAKARAVLETEVMGGGMAAFGAAQALRRWKEGTWTLDPA